MAKVLVIDDFHTYSEMISLLIEKKGKHEVQADILPFDTDRVHAFAPEVIVVSLVRKVEALASRLTDFYREVDGAKALKAFTADENLRRYPLIITAIGLEERELPADVDYVAFVDIPHRLDYLIEMIDRVAASRGRDILEQ